MGWTSLGLPDSTAPVEGRPVISILVQQSRCMRSTEEEVRHEIHSTVPVPCRRRRYVIRFLPTALMVGARSLHTSHTGQAKDDGSQLESGVTNARRHPPV